jgi:hypothetical protein
LCVCALSLSLSDLNFPYLQTHHASRARIEKRIKNQMVFMKTEETGLDSVYQMVFARKLSLVTLANWFIGRFYRFIKQFYSVVRFFNPRPGIATRIHDAQCFGGSITWDQRGGRAQILACSATWRKEALMPSKIIWFLFFHMLHQKKRMTPAKICCSFLEPARNTACSHP